MDQGGYIFYAGAILAGVSCRRRFRSSIEYITSLGWTRMVIVDNRAAVNSTYAPGVRKK